MMPGARTPVPDRYEIDEIEQSPEDAPSGSGAVDAAEGAARDVSARNAMSAAERLEREARWACEWWPPD